MASLHMSRFAKSVLDTGYGAGDTAEYKEAERPIQQKGASANSNIRIGTTKPTYDTEGTLNFGWPQGFEAAEQVDCKALQNAHFVLGNEKLEYTKTSFMADPMKMGGKPRKAFGGNQKAHFNLGTEKMAYESSTQSGYDIHKDPVNPYKAFDKRSDRVAEAAQAALSKVSNVSIGRKGAGTDADHFRSTMEMHYVDKGADGLTTLDKGALDDLRATHYSLGNETCDYVTTNDLGVQLGELARVVRPANIQKTHFTLGSQRVGLPVGVQGGAGEKRSHQGR